MKITFIHSGIVLTALLAGNGCSTENPVISTANAQSSAPEAALPHMVVYKSPTCGCCKGWVKHLEEHNFTVKDLTVADVNQHKLRLNVPTQAASCHTAVVNGVVIEGHVPAQDIKRLLASDHDIRLLTVPAMPSGTPGMDTPGAPKQPFKVYAISNSDQVSVFNDYADY